MVDRLFQIVYLLLEKPRLTAKELAGVFEVSERTIYRDIDKLSLSGIPVYTNQGRSGGISLLPDYVLDKSVLTEDEKKRVFESLCAVNEVGLKEYDEVIGKLRSFFGGEHQEWLEIEFSSWGNREHDNELFSKLKEAVLSRRYTDIVYYGIRGEKSVRRIKPLKLCFKNQDWYLYSYCCMRQDYRFFKLSRIAQFSVTGEQFTPEEVGRVLPGASSGYSAGAVSVKAELEIDSEMAFRAYDELLDVKEADNGRLTCTVEVPDMKWFIGYVLSYGSHMRVLGPPEIREELAREAEKMSRIYSA